MTIRSGPPRLLTRTLVATFTTSTCVLAVVMVVVSVLVERSVQSSVAGSLSAVQQVLVASEQRRSDELMASARALSEQPRLKAALDTFQSESRWSHPTPDLLATLQREAERLARSSEADLVAILDEGGVSLAAGGAQSTDWSATNEGVSLAVEPRGGQHVVAVGDGIARAQVIPLELLDARVGWLLVAELLDRTFAERLADLAGTGIVVVEDGAVRTSSLPALDEATLSHTWADAPSAEGTVTLNGDSYAHRRILDLGDAAVYALGSIDAVALPATRDARRAMLGLAVLALLLSAGASVWLSRSITRPIHELSRSVEAMATTRSLDARLPATGSSRELDSLADVVNSLVEALAMADAETQSAYVAAIRGLAATLDARDPYTAGHSERVSLLSVGIGRRLALGESDIELLRVGALLHDIGKIGVPDAILQKTGRLSNEEFTVIKTHTTLGAKILKTMPFLAIHVPVAELHHERLDGRGYPHGLRGDEIPIHAQIVHVADAYDAMTTARAYRDARTRQEAIDELWRCAGSDFDAASVQGLVAALPDIHLPDVPTPADRLRLVALGRGDGVEVLTWERAG